MVSKVTAPETTTTAKATAAKSSGKSSGKSNVPSRLAAKVGQLFEREDHYCTDDKADDKKVDLGSLLKGAGRMATGALAVVAGAATIAAGGPALLIAATAVTVTAGRLTVLNGTADIQQSITGDNYIRDSVFNGNQKGYDTYAGVTEVAAAVGTSFCLGYSSTNGSASVEVAETKDTGRTFQSQYEIPTNEEGYTKSNLQLGQAVHKEYKLDTVDNITKFKEYTLPNGKRVDYIDFETKTVYELKPYNTNQIKQGTKQLEVYLQEIEKNYGEGWTTILDTY